MHPLQTSTITITLSFLNSPPSSSSPSFSSSFPISPFPWRSWSRSGFVLLPLRPVDPSIFSSGTYVVQIPKDQIYRIPPPENALIVERHRNPSVTSTHRRRSCCLSFFLPISIVLVLIILLAIFLPPLLTPPKPPSSNSPISNSVLPTATSTSNSTSSTLTPPPPFPSNLPRMPPLSFRKRELAAGKFPLIRQEHGSKRHVALALHAKSPSSFPKEFQRRMKDKKSKLRVAMSLKMNLPAETTGRLSTHRNVRFVVVCSFTVNTLGKDSKILSQNCESQRQ